MGVYLNPSNQLFKEALDSQIYVDKTEMILYLNSVLSTKQKYLAVSRPRRFGKTMVYIIITLLTTTKYLSIFQTSYGDDINSVISFIRILCCGYNKLKIRKS